MTRTRKNHLRTLFGGHSLTIVGMQWEVRISRDLHCVVAQGHRIVWWHSWTGCLSLMLTLESVPPRPDLMVSLSTLPGSWVYPPSFCLSSSFYLPPPTSSATAASALSPIAVPLSHRSIPQPFPGCPDAHLAPVTLSTTAIHRMKVKQRPFSVSQSKQKHHPEAGKTHLSEVNLTHLLTAQC